MEVVLCRNTALTLWRALGDKAPRPMSSRAHLRNADPAVLATIDTRLAFAALPAKHVVEILVGKHADRRRGRRVKFHVWSTPVPQRALARLEDGIMLSSPEFVFLQLALDLPLYDLIQLGCELCGTYALTPGTAKGFTTRNSSLTTTERIKAFLERCPSGKGLKRARQAAQYIFDGSASPMETALTMILCLPVRHGGYGFPLPVLNKEMTLVFTDSSSNQKRSRVCRCDLLWPERAFAIEYESDAEHLSSQKFQEDSIRRNDLVSTNTTVITVTKGQVLNLSHWPTLAHHVSTGLKEKPRIRIQDHYERQKALYARLFGRFFSRFD